MLKEEIFKLLDTKIAGFFPAQGNWKSSCFDKPKKIDEEYFPCNTRDSEWLASMLKEKFKIFYLPKSLLKEYVETSEEFDKQCKSYEQRVVTWQIWWMISDGDNWIIDPNLGGDLYLLSPKCDLAFRKGVVDTLSAIGMPMDAIEAGIEKNVGTWRDFYINQAFKNTYEPYMYIPSYVKTKLDSVNPEFKEKWKKRRLYQYYLDHKESVEKYGTITDEMKMTKEEVEKLDEYLKVKSEERLKEIKDFQKIICSPPSNLPDSNKRKRFVNNN